MRKFAITGLMILAFSAPAFAKTKYYVVIDTVHNCSVVEAKPSAGLKVLKGGFPSEEAAKKALAKMGKKCKGIVE